MWVQRREGNGDDNNHDMRIFRIQPLGGINPRKYACTGQVHASLFGLGWTWARTDPVSEARPRRPGTLAFVATH